MTPRRAYELTFLATGDRVAAEEQHARVLEQLLKSGVDLANYDLDLPGYADR